MKLPRPLVLASTSPFRRMLLERLDLPFTSCAPQVDESARDDESPQELVRRLSEAKARAAVPAHPDALIIGSDQVAVVDGKAVGKPGDHAGAVRQLRNAAGKSVLFHTGLCLLNAATGTVQLDVIPFEVTFRELSDRQIENYLRHDQPYGCAGSFRSEAMGIALFKRMSGDDPNTLMGLPLIRLIEMLEAEGVEII